MPTTPLRRYACLASVAVAAGLLATTAPAMARQIDPLPPCQQPIPPSYCPTLPLNPTGTLDSVVRTPAGLVVSGTATDPTGKGPVVVSIQVNNVPAGSLLADGPGDSYSGTVKSLPGLLVCAVARNSRGQDVTLACRKPTTVPPPPAAR